MLRAAYEQQNMSLYDARVFENFETFSDNTMFPHIFRYLMMSIALYWPITKLLGFIRKGKLVSLLVKAVIVWVLCYLLLVTVYDIGPDESTITRLSSFAFYGNFYLFLNDVDFYQDTYLNRLCIVTNIQDTIMLNRSIYENYLLGKCELNLDLLVFDLITLFLWMLSFFSVYDWAKFTARVVWAFPIFVILPASMEMFASPKSGLTYAAYVIHGYICTIHNVLSSGAAWEFSDFYFQHELTSFENKLASIDFLWFVIDIFTEILLY